MVNRLELEINLGFSAPYSEELNKEVIEELKEEVLCNIKENITNVFSNFPQLEYVKLDIYKGYMNENKESNEPPFYVTIGNKVLIPMVR